jgi:hypothetical protein
MATLNRLRDWLFLTTALALAPPSSAVAADYCTPTARNQLTACRGEVTDDYYTATAICLNESNSGDRNQCNHDAVAARDDQSQLCDEQFAARKAICARLGEGRYDPDFEEQNFVSDFAHP